MATDSLSRLFLMFFFCLVALADVEKIIFVAPEAPLMPTDASIDNLLLAPLSESQPMLRTFLNASHATQVASKGSETWMLLTDLKPGRRYEVRVCWLATQPTSFLLYHHTMEVVFSNPDLLASLTTYSNARHASITKAELSDHQSRTEMRRSSPNSSSTFLFLQIFAKADFFTLDKAMMENVPPVHVDIILDPYLLNLFPKSLGPTAVYLVVIAIIGWMLSGWINHLITVHITTPAESPGRKSR